jgi:hypothetical protein
MSSAAPTVRCPMRECRRAIALGELPAFPALPARAPCLHFVAAWGPPPGRAPLAEDALFALDGNRELVIRNLRPAEVEPAAIEAQRTDLNAAARRFAHAVDASTGDAATNDDAGAQTWGALFGDPHERDAVAREFARLLLGVPVQTGATR